MGAEDNSTRTYTGPGSGYDGIGGDKWVDREIGGSRSWYQFLVVGYKNTEAFILNSDFPSYKEFVSGPSLFLSGVSCRTARVLMDSWQWLRWNIPLGWNVNGSAFFVAGRQSHLALTLNSVLNPISKSRSSGLHKSSSFYFPSFSQLRKRCYWSGNPFSSQ